MFRTCQRHTKVNQTTKYHLPCSCDGKTLAVLNAAQVAFHKGICQAAKIISESVITEDLCIRPHVDAEAGTTNTFANSLQIILP